MDRNPFPATESLASEDSTFSQKKQEIDAALIDTVLVSLRGCLKELEGDNWKYEAPRYTCH